MRRSIIVAAATYGLRLGGFFLGRSPRRRVLMVIASAALLGALLGGVFRLAWPETALADPCISLPYGNDEASDGYHAGMRSSQMTVEDYATTCIEIDSLGLLGPGQASVEIGVSHDGSNVLDCEGTGFKSAPYLFVVHVTQTGGYNCVQPSGQSVTPWAKEGFSLQDQDRWVLATSLTTAATSPIPSGRSTGRRVQLSPIASATMPQICPGDTSNRTFS